MIEIRSYATSQPTVDGRTISGIAIPYNSDSLPIGGEFVERFMPGSVSETIKSGHIELWAHHERTKPIGSQASNLELWEETDGLHYRALLPEKNSDADNVISLLTAKKPIIGGTSFGFDVHADGQRWFKENGRIIREIRKARIEHISPVVTPAYPGSSAAIRSAKIDDIRATYGEAAIELLSKSLTPKLIEAQRAAAAILI